MDFHLTGSEVCDYRGGAWGVGVEKSKKSCFIFLTFKGAELCVQQLKFPHKGTVAIHGPSDGISQESQQRDTELIKCCLAN